MYYSLVIVKKIVYIYATVYGRNGPRNAKGDKAKDSHHAGCWPVPCNLKHTDMEKIVFDIETVPRKPGPGYKEAWGVWGDRRYKRPVQFG